MTDSVAYLLGVVIAIAVEVPVHRALRRSAPRTQAMMLTAVVMVVAGAAAYAFLAP